MSYLEVSEDQDDCEDVEMPKIEDDVPPSWTTVEGDFLNVYASKQSWLDYTAQLHPEVRCHPDVHQC